MKQRGTYFVLNREAGLKKGSGAGIEIGESGVSLKKDAENGIYYTGVLDSRERCMEWHRLKMDGRFFGEDSVKATVYAADSPYPQNSTMTFQEIVRSYEWNQYQKDEIFERYRRAEFFQPMDVLLHDVEGRYLWIKIELKAQGEWRPYIERMQIYFPKHTWISYLPEIYQEDIESASFLERYLSIFQSIYEDMTEKIERIPSFLDPDTGEEGALYELADWFGIEHTDLWTVEQLKYLVKNAPRISQTRGSVNSLKELVKLHTGKDAYIIEYHQLQPYFDGGNKEQLLKKLYAAHPYEFSILIDVEDFVQGSQFLILEQIVNMVKPAHMECRIIALKPYIFLNQHSYLGINSVLGEYRPLRLDGLCAMPFSTISV